MFLNLRVAKRYERVANKLQKWVLLQRRNKRLWLFFSSLRGCLGRPAPHTPLKGLGSEVRGTGRAGGCFLLQLFTGSGLAMEVYKWVLDKKGREPLA